MRSEWQIRREIVEVGRRLYDRQLVAATDGNISARIRADHLLVTPAGSCLGELRPEELLYIVPGHPQPPGRRLPTSELAMHVAAYGGRPEIGAIVHAHPPSATAFTVAGLSLARPVLPEVVALLGEIPTAGYATPSTPQGADVIRDLIRRHDAILLDRHGALTVGSDPLDAFRKLEIVEHCAKVLLAAQQFGSVQPLPPQEIAHLIALRSERGPGGKTTRQLFRESGGP